MGVLLVNPGPTVALTAGYYRRMLAPMPPISLAYLAAALEEAGVDVRVHDDSVPGADEAALEATLRRLRPEVVGLSVVTALMPDVERLVHVIRRVAPEARVVLGNIHADIFAASLLRSGLADVIVHGEGEETLVELVRALSDGGATASADLDAVAGLSFVRDGEVVTTPRRPYVQDLDTLPFPAWHLFPIEHYRIFQFARVRDPGTLVLGSRGCPYGCTFCSLKIMGAKRRRRSAVNIVDELEHLHDRFGYVQPSFIDPIFPISHREGLEFAAEMVRRGLHRKQVWVTETRVDLVDLELLQALREAGLRRIMFGFEAGEQAQLDTVSKSSKLGQAQEAVALCRKAGVEIIGFFMLGIPGSNRASLQHTIDFACGLDIDFAKFSVFVPFPGTECYEELMRSGEIDEPTNWRRYTSYPTPAVPPSYLPRGVTTQDIIRAQRKAYTAFYLRPGMVYRQVCQLRTLQPRDFVDAARTLLASRFGRG